MAVRPTLRSLILADNVYQDAGTKKMIIAGTFNLLWSPTFPAQLGRTVWCYAAITDVIGECNLDFRFVDLTNNEVLVQGALKLTCNDPLKTIEIRMEVPPLPLPHDGVFAWEVHWKNEMLSTIRITVAKQGGEANE